MLRPVGSGRHGVSKEEAHVLHLGSTFVFQNGVRKTSTRRRAEPGSMRSAAIEDAGRLGMKGDAARLENAERQREDGLGCGEACCAI